MNTERGEIRVLQIFGGLYEDFKRKYTICIFNKISSISNLVRNLIKYREKNVNLINTNFN